VRQTEDQISCCCYVTAIQVIIGEDALVESIFPISYLPLSRS